jgi:ElaB/YqjD/DUF883 family membrane-anchored ribosome-binding protein
MTTEQGGSSGAVAEVREKGAELVSAAQEQVETKAGELRGEAGFQLSEQVNQRSTELGDQVQALGEALRSGAQQLRTQGKAPTATIAEKAAQAAEDVGRYLQSSDADRILGDVERFARQRPWLTAGVGALAGFVASRFVKASGDRRYEAAQGNGQTRGYGPQSSR